MVCLQTDDTVYACNEQFSRLEEQMGRVSDTKPARLLSDGDKIKLNGAIISQYTLTLSLTQPDHINKLKELDVNNVTTPDFVVERARGAYTAAICRPDAIYAFNIASQTTDPKKKDFQNLKR